MMKKRALRVLLTGFAMGSADIVPGVSGGTIAFISGIYEELVNSIKKVSGETLALFVRGRIREAIGSIPFTFLVPLALGIGAAIIALSNLLSWLLKTYPVFVWSFFFGLVLASILVVRKRITRWELHDIGVLLAFAVLAYAVVGAVPMQTPATLLAFFLAGAVAIVAMILPGISGSFILVLLGKYEQVLAAVTERDLLALGVVILGAVLGLALFSRVLSWLFARHHDLAIAALTGFMLGSLRKIWPWKEVVTPDGGGEGVADAVQAVNVLPPALDGSVLLAVLLILLGMAIILYLNTKARQHEDTKVGSL